MDSINVLCESYPEELLESLIKLTYNHFNNLSKDRTEYLFLKVSDL